MKSQPGGFRHGETDELFCVLCLHILSWNPLRALCQHSYLLCSALLFWFWRCEHTFFATGDSSSCSVPLSLADTPQVCSWYCAPGCCAISCGYLEIPGVQTSITELAFMLHLCQGSKILLLENILSFYTCKKYKGNIWSWLRRLIQQL